MPPKGRVLSRTNRGFYMGDLPLEMFAKFRLCKKKKTRLVRYYRLILFCIELLIVVDSFIT